MERTLKDQIAAALASTKEAERSLEAALAVLQAAPRAEKVTVTQAVQEAFDRLRTAQAILATLATP